MGEIFAGILLFMYVTVGMWALNKLYYSRIDMIIYESYWDFIKKKISDCNIFWVAFDSYSSNCRYS